MCPYPPCHPFHKQNIHFNIDLARAIVSVMQTKPSFMLKALFTHISTGTLFQMYFESHHDSVGDHGAQRSILNVHANKLTYANSASVGVSFYFHSSDEYRPSSQRYIFFYEVK